MTAPLRWLLCLGLALWASPAPAQEVDHELLRRTAPWADESILFRPIDLLAEAAAAEAGGEPRPWEGPTFAERSGACSLAFVPGLVPGAEGGISSDVGSSADVHALAVFDDGTGPALYAAGSFDSAGGRWVDGVARWDGTSWLPVGGGFSGSSGTVRALTAFDDGSGAALYAAGDFSHAGGLQVNGIARWDGRAWRRVGLGFNAAADALVIFDDGTGPALYAGGSFGLVDWGTGWHGTSLSSPAEGFARWDGERWQSVAYGQALYPRDFEVLPGGLGGGLALTGLGGIWRWDGASATPLFSSYDSTSNLEVWGGALWVRVDLTLQRWQGGSWNAPASPGYVEHLFAWPGSPSVLYAAGELGGSPGNPAARLARWDGSSWLSLGDGAGGELLVLGSWDDGSGAALLAGGDRRLDRFTGTAWQPLGSGAGLDGPVLALTTFDAGSGAEVYAAGSFTGDGGQALGGVARWRDATGWSGLGAGVDGPVYALTAFDDGTGEALWAGGDFSTAGGSPAARVARWNGGAWEALGSGLPAPVRAFAVADLGAGPALFAAGGSGSADGFVARWDGAGWTLLASGLDGMVTALAGWSEGDTSALVAGGSFTAVGGASALRLARFDGAAWSQHGGGANGTVWALLAWDDGGGEGLYAAGAFTQVGATAAKRVARWRSGAWQQGSSQGLGGSTLAASDYVATLGTFDDGSGERLYAGGSFTASGGSAVARLARLEGSIWTQAGGGVDSTVQALVPAPTGVGLYVGGGVEAPGGVPSHHLAKLQMPNECPAGGVVLEEPLDGLLTTAGSVVFRGRLTREGRLFVNGRAVPVAWDLSFLSSSFTLAEGENVFSLELVPTTGNPLLTAVRVVRDSVAPVVEILEPTAGQTVFSSRPELRLRVTDSGAGVDPQTVALRLGGSPIAASCTTTGSEARCVPAADLPSGSVSLTATARDGAANLGTSAPKVFTVDPRPQPSTTTVVGIVHDAGGQPVAGARVSVLGVPGASGLAEVDGSFSIANVPVSTAEPLTVAALAPAGAPMRSALAAGLVPQPGGLTDAGTLTLAVACPPELSAVLGAGVGVSGTASPRVLALAVHDDGGGPALYLGGDFTAAGGIPASYLARWTGSAFEAVGTGTNGPVRALAVWDDGTGPALFVGGSFSQAGGAPAANLARFRGGAFTALGAGVDGAVYALAAGDDGSGPALFAGGAFTNAGGASALRIARWDGAVWSPLGSGISTAYGLNDPIVYALRFVDDGTGSALYAGGSFDRAGGQTARKIARWNGAAWSPLGFGLGSGSGDSSFVMVSSLAVYDDGRGPALYAAGNFGSAGASGTDGSIGRWDGATWQSLGGGLDASGVALQLPQGVQALAVFDAGAGARLYAAGEITGASGTPVSHLAAWDGSSWHAAGAGLSAGGWGGMALAAWNGGLYVGGAFDLGDGAPAGGLARLDGAGLSALGQGTSGAVHAATVWDDGSGPALYLAGTFLAIDGLPARRVARFDGRAWSSLGEGLDGPVYALEGWNGNLYAAGAFTSAGGTTGGAGDVSASRIARWDGDGWSSLGSGLSATAYDLAVWDDGSGSALYVAGAFTTAGSVSASRIARWSGSTWSALGSGLSGEARALAVYDDGGGSALFAGGAFLSAGGAAATRVARWRGGAWASVGSTIPNTVHALTTFDDGGGLALFAGGGDSATCCGFVRRYRAGAWSTLGDAPTGRVLSLGTYDDGAGPRLFAGGEHQTVGSLAARGAIRWSGSAWQALGTGLDGAVRAFAAFDDGGGPALFLGGSFTTVAGETSVALARWRRPSACTGDLTEPTLTVTSPAAGALLTSARPVFSLTYGDEGSGIDTGSIALSVGGSPVGLSCTAGATSATCQPTADLPEGALSLGLAVADLAGNVASAGLAVTVDTQAPTLAFTGPAAGSWQTVLRPSLTFTASDAGAGVSASTLAVTRSGAAVSTSCSLAGTVLTCTLLQDLPQGASTLSATVRDGANRLSAAAQRAFSVDTVVPSLTFDAPAAGATLTQTQPELRVTATDATSGITQATLAFERDGVSVPVTCSWTAGTATCLPTSPLSLGPVSLTARVADAAGNLSAPAACSFTLEGPSGPTPDQVPPRLSFYQPAQGGYLAPTSGLLELLAGDDGSGVDPESFVLTANGTAVATTCTACWPLLSCRLTGALPPGSLLSFQATVRDLAGNLSPPAQAQLATVAGLDLLAPALTLESPPDGLLTREPSLLLVGGVSEPATVTLAGAPVALDGANRFAHPVVLAEGESTLTLVATDGAGNSGQVAVTVTLDTTGPGAVDLSKVSVAEPVAGQAVITGSSGAVAVSEDGLEVEIANLATAGSLRVAVAGNGSFSATAGAVAQDRLRLAVVDPAGNAGPAGLVTVPGLIPIPPDPATVAPPLDRTVAGDFCASYAFLWSGANRVQYGVAADAIDCAAAGLLSGRVIDRDGSPLAGVKVRFRDQPALGVTLTRADGAWDLASGIGGEVAVVFEKAGYLPALRLVRPRRGEAARVVDVALVPLDSAATAATFSSASPAQLAQGTAVTDGDGTRRATLWFPAGTRAELVLAGGARQSIGSGTVRATEYTVGPRGEAAMPAPLPSSSAYTYAVELSLDEALALGAEQVVFSQPVLSYTENFLAFPVGTVIPVGFYDRAASRWVPSEDGRVIEILAAPGGLATLDLSGNGTAATPAELSALGITDAERTRLASLYPVGQQLWRVRVGHFTPWDYNFPAEPSPSQAGPPEKPPADPPQGGDQDKKPDPCTASGSIIECENQVLGEVLPVTGTPFTLHYQSDRVPGRKAARQLMIPMTPQEVPQGVTHVMTEVEVAGQFHTQTVPAGAGQSQPFEWDGKDDLGRDTQGRQPYTATVTYLYDADYLSPRCGDRPCFAQTGQQPPVAPARTQIPARRSHRGTLGQWDARSALEMGGWSLSIHHAYDPANQILYQGDGTWRDVKNAQVVRTFAGGLGSGGGSSDPDVDGPTDLVWAPAAPSVGAPQGGKGYYFINSGTCQVKHADGLGQVTTVAGAGCSTGTRVGLSDVAGLEQLAPTTLEMLPYDLEVDPAGNLYVLEQSRGDLDTFNYRFGRLLKIRPNGKMEVVLQSESPNQVASAAVNADGAVYFNHSRYVYRLDASLSGDRTLTEAANLARVTRVAGADLYPPPPVSAAEYASVRTARSLDLVLSQCVSLRFAPTGDLYCSDRDRISRLTPEGYWQHVAGNVGQNDRGPILQPNGVPGEDFGPFWSGDGCPASGLPAKPGCPSTGAEIDIRSGELAFAPDSSLYFADQGNHRIRRIDGQGLITTVAGSGPAGYLNGGYGFANDRVRASRLNRPLDVEVLDDGALVIADFGNHQLTTTLPPKAYDVVQAEVIKVPSEDGAVLYVFDRYGHHLETQSAANLQTLFTFGYDSAFRLVSVTDVFGHVTQLVRDGTGQVDRIVAPFGQVTELLIGGSGYLTEVADPLGHTVSFAYTSDGLMTGMEDARGHSSTFTWDGAGRLIQDEDALGGFTALSRSEPEPASGVTAVHEVTKSTAMGRETLHRTEQLIEGGVRTTVIGPDGLASAAQQNPDGSRSTTYPDGTAVTLTTAPDPRLGALAPIASSATTTTPGGLTSSLTSSREMVRKPGNVPGYAPEDIRNFKLVDAVTVGQRTTGSEYDFYTLELVVTTPLGRQSRSVKDDIGRVVEAEAPGVDPVTYEYDTDGRISQVTQGGRTTSYAYNPAGYLASATDPAGRTVTYTYDAAGRTTSQTLPGGRVVSFRYDANGNLVGLTPPSRPEHGFSWDEVDRPKTNDPPDVGLGSETTTLTYNLDHQLTQVARPDGVTIDYAYDAVNGRLSTVTTPRGAYTYSYSPTSGRVSSITDPSTGSLAFSYDGALPTGITWAGEVAGSVTWTYNSYFEPIERKINGANAVTYTFDADGALSQAGDLNLAYHPTTGLPTTSELLGVTDEVTLTNLGELSTYESLFQGNVLLGYELTRDNLGRITSRMETLGTESILWEYQYDPEGRLIEVKRAGAVVETYGYDANGNRTTWTDGWGTGTATHDDQDRLLTAGDYTFTYTANGELLTKSQNGENVTYQYDVNGALLGVDLPDGTAIDYVTDAAGRRIGKKVNGTLIKGYLYAGISPVAELDGVGNVIATFIYGRKPHVPDYMLKDGKKYRFVTDHLGSVRLVVDAGTGEIAQRIDYNAFGRITLDTNPGFQPFAFAGGLYDYQTGLTRFGARDYDAQVGRWTARDPAGFGGGDANLWGYVASDPINLIDPEGLWAFPWEALDLYSYQQSSSEWVQAKNQFLDNPGWRTGLSALARLLTAAGDGAALILPAVPGSGGISQAGIRAINRPNCPKTRPSPALRGDPYNPDAVAARVRPEYRPNPAHEPGFRLSPRKTPEPADAAAVYQAASRADMGTWYGRGEQGWYRYFYDNAGGVHFSGIVPEAQVPAGIR